MLVTQFFSGCLIGLSVGRLAVARTLGTNVFFAHWFKSSEPSDRVVISPCRAVLTVALLAWTQAFRSYSLKIQIQHYTVDYLAQGSMKNGANSEMPCELQDTWTSTLWTHIAEISSSCFHTWLRVGLTSIKQLAVLHWAVTVCAHWHSYGCLCLSLCGSKICWLSLQSLNSWDFQSWVVRTLCSVVQVEPF